MKENVTTGNTAQNQMMEININNNYNKHKCNF